MKGKKEMREFNLCDLCSKPQENKCSMYYKNPGAKVIDCGSFLPDSRKTSLHEAAIAVMRNK